MYCEALFTGLDRRLEEKMDINTIAEELCPTVSRGREKIVKLIKSHKGSNWLIENHEWLGYSIDHIRNTKGRPVKNEPNESRLHHISLRMKRPGAQQIEAWVECLTEICDTLDEMDDQFVDTTVSRHRIKIHALLKRTRELRMILKAKGD